MRISPTAALLAVLLVLSGAAGATANGSARPRCVPQHRVHTLLRTHRVWVWAVPHWDSVNFGNDVHACLFSVGQPRWLTPQFAGGCEPGGCESADTFSVAAPYLAYDYSECAYSDCDLEVRVLDLRTGRLRHSAFPADFNDTNVVATVVTRDGSVGWLVEPDNPTVYEVWKDDGKRPHRLARSATIDPNSLRLHGSTMTWTDAGTTRSARLR